MRLLIYQITSHQKRVIHHLHLILHPQRTLSKDKHFDKFIMEEFLEEHKKGEHNRKEATRIAEKSNRVVEVDDDVGQ